MLYTLRKLSESVTSLVTKKYKVKELSLEKVNWQSLF